MEPKSSSSSSKYHQTTMNIWKEEFETFSNDFIRSIQAFCNVHYRNDCEQDCYLGYIIQTKQKQTYIFGETLCRWLSLKYDSYEPQELCTLNGKIIKQVDYGLDFFVILTTDGCVYLASSDPYWETDRKLKWIDTGSVNIENIACGHEHLLLLRFDRRLMAMGWNGLGQTTGTAEHSHRSLVYTGLENVRKISCGWAHSLALTDTGRLYSWGLNESGRLGLNDEMNRNIPNLIEFECDCQIKDFVAGAAHSLFLMQNGYLYGCGWNDNGELGSSDFDQFELSPIRLPIENVKSIATGWSYRFTIAFTNDNCCYVWGELGQGTMATIKLYHPTKIIPDLLSSWSFSSISSLYFDPPLTFGWCHRNINKLKIKQLNFNDYSQRIQCDPEHDYVNMMVKRFSITSDHSLTFP